VAALPDGGFVTRDWKTGNVVHGILSRH